LEGIGPLLSLNVMSIHLCRYSVFWDQEPLKSPIVRDFEPYSIASMFPKGHLDWFPIVSRLEEYSSIKAIHS